MPAGLKDPESRQLRVWKRELKRASEPARAEKLRQLIAEKSKALRAARYPQATKAKTTKVQEHIRGRSKIKSHMRKLRSKVPAHTRGGKKVKAHTRKPRGATKRKPK